MHHRDQSCLYVTTDMRVARCPGQSLWITDLFSSFHWVDELSSLVLTTESCAVRLLRHLWVFILQLNSGQGAKGTLLVLKELTLSSDTGSH